MTNDRVPKWAEIIKHAIAQNRSELHTALPGRVRDYNATEKVATIELQLKRIARKRSGEPIAKAFPLLPRVPVGQPAAGGYFVHLPVTAGDFVWVFFSERNFDAYRGKGRLTEPNSEALHDLGNGFAMPVYEVSGPPSDAVANKLVMGRVGGAVMAIDETHVNLGDSTGAAAVARADRVDAEIQRIWTLLTTWVVVAQDGGAALQAQAIDDAVAVQSTAASKARVT